MNIRYVDHVGKAVVFGLGCLFGANTSALPPRGDWTDGNVQHAFAPNNARGHQPVYAVARAALGATGVSRQALDQVTYIGSGNFAFSVPILSLPGRGLDVNLALYHNAQLWTALPDHTVYDIDHGWPAPGWSLGYGKLVAGVLIDADFTRHYRRVVPTAPDGPIEATYQTTDGTFIDYVVYRGTAASARRAVATYANGTVVNYGAEDAKHVLYPVRITDSNGNYITISYLRNNVGPELASIVDTLGRTIQFSYNVLGQLSEISGPGAGQGATLDYRDIPVPNHLPLTVPACVIPGTDYGLCQDNWSTAPAINSIYSRVTKSQFYFGASDSYSDYGVMTKIIERVAGGPPPGWVNRRVSVYNFPFKVACAPKQPGDIGCTSATSAAPPTYDSLTQTWAGMTVPPAVTKYAIGAGSAASETRITQPDGTVFVSQTGPDGNVSSTSLQDALGHTLSASKLTWEIGDRSSPRLRRTERTNDRGQVAEIRYYFGSKYNRVTQVSRYGYGGTVPLVTTRTEFLDGQWESTHLLYLPSFVELFEGETWSDRVARTEFIYDADMPAPRPGIVSNTALVGPRGNVSKVTRYADAQHLGGALLESRSYDVAGNLIKVQQYNKATRTDYSVATQYAYPDKITIGDVDMTSPLHFSSKFVYDFNSGRLKSTTDTNNLTTTFEEWPDGRPNIVRSATGAVTLYAYDDSKFTVRSEVLAPVDHFSGGLHYVVMESQGSSTDTFDGRGQLIRSEVATAAGQVSIAEQKFAVQGRLQDRSLPYRTGDTIQWEHRTYDPLGRLSTVAAPDKSTQTYHYNETLRPVGASTVDDGTRVVDAWGRERFFVTDSLGRLVQVFEPDAGGGGSVLSPKTQKTSYSYNAANQLTTITQDLDGGQSRLHSYWYDSLGRLVRERTPEAKATLNESGNYTTTAFAPLYTAFYQYDRRSNLIARTDARGVKAQYHYYPPGLFTIDNVADPLERLQRITYDVTGFGDKSHPIDPAPDVAIEYESIGDLRRPHSITVAGVSTEAYATHRQYRCATQLLLPVRCPRAPQARGIVPWSWSRPCRDGTGVWIRCVRRAHLGEGLRARSVCRVYRRH